MRLTGGIRAHADAAGLKIDWDNPHSTLSPWASISQVPKAFDFESSHWPRVTPNEVAATFAELLGKPVRMEIVPRDTWDQLFRSQGMKNPEPRIRMLDGFNEGWIEFESGEAGSRKGTVALKTVLNTLIERARL